MKDIKIIPVILSGGSGTRLWPLSRKYYPKQYLPLVSNYTMLQETILRLNNLKNLSDPIVICNTEHRFLVAEQLQQIDINSPTILLEPCGRDTAPAIAAAAFQAIKNGSNEDVILLVLSADHVIQDIETFHEAISLAVTQAEMGRLTTFGIVPTNPNTGYGYIKIALSDNEQCAYKVEEFVEKPDQKTAEEYVAKGNYLWNSGVFMFRADVLIDELTTYSSSIINSVKDSVENATKNLDFICLDEKSFESSPSNSIDYALMEKSSNVSVIPLDAGWSDIGSWSVLYDISQKDNNGNVIKGDVFTDNTKSSYINAKYHLVATVGVQDLIIVDTPNATLIASKNEAQNVKNIVNQLQQEERFEQFCHRKVYRPWGWYDCIEKGKNFQVKKLYVNPSAKLSLQKHI